MFLMFGDEADHERGRDNRFFVYGAVFIPANRAHSLHVAIEALRNQHGFQSQDSFKFATNTRPNGMDRDVHAAAKSQLMMLAAEHDVTFSAYVSLHELARNRSHNELVAFGINTSLGKFNQFLREKDSFGCCFLDRIPIEHPYRYLAEKFRIGLTFPGGRAARLDRIVGLSSTCDGASHFSSVSDIVLGSFRYCVNEPERDIAGRALLPQVARLMWHVEHRSMIYVKERGLTLRPKEVRAPEHQAEYEGLTRRLQEYLAGDEHRARM